LTLYSTLTESRCVNGWIGVLYDSVEPNEASSRAAKFWECTDDICCPCSTAGSGRQRSVVRSLARDTRERLYRRENDIPNTLRILLGALAGLAIGWFLKPQDVSGFNAISPFALAFVAGYSVDLLFTFLDKIVNAFSAPQDASSPKAP
jgi:hypothetical protein